MVPIGRQVSTNVSRSNLLPRMGLEWAPTFEWCALMLGSKNGHWNDTCSKEIELICAQNC